MRNRPIETFEIWRAATEIEIAALNGLALALTADETHRWFWGLSDLLYTSVYTHKQVREFWEFVRDKKGLFYADDWARAIIVFYQTMPTPPLV